MNASLTDGFSFGNDLTDAERDSIGTELENHSVPLAPGLNARPVEIVLRDKSGQLAGGLLGSTAWNWLLIDLLWIATQQRSKGFGSELLKRAEQLAKKLGCTHARTETFDFQALAFYERHGYKMYGKLQNFPAGHTEFQLQKNLT